MSRARVLSAVLAAVVACAACASARTTEEAGAASGDLEVVVTTSILGDVVQHIVGEVGTVEVLIPHGSDPHAFEPSAQQAEAMRQADLVVANGLTLEEGLDPVLETVESEGVRILRVAEAVDPIEVGTRHADEHGGDDHRHGQLDPHFWTDPLRMADAAHVIGRQLAEVGDSLDAARWEARAEEYADEARALHADIEDLLAAVPQSRRKLVTNHEAFGYFAERYGFEHVGTVVPGGTTMAEPSPADLAELVETIEREDVPAIFAENTQPTRLAEAVAAELGEAVAVVELYSDSLGADGSGAGTYVEMMRTNARRIAEALGG